MVYIDKYIYKKYNYIININKNINKINIIINIY